MRPFRIVGPSDAGKTTLIERLVPKLAERGDVATVKHLDCRVEIDEPGKDTYRHRAAGAAETYGVMPAGSWFATGRDRDLGELLVALAPEYEYVLIEGYSTDGRVPAVVLGDRDHAGRAIATAPGVDAIDLRDTLACVDRCDGIETRDSLVSDIREAIDSERTSTIATCVATQPTADHEGWLDRRQRRNLEAALDTCRGTIDGNESLTAVETHHRPRLAEESGHVAFVAIAAQTHAEAVDIITEFGTRLREALPDSSTEMATMWTD